MERSTLKFPPQTSIDTKSVHHLVYAAGPYFFTQPLSNYIKTPAFGAILESTDASAINIRTVYGLAFGFGTPPQSASDMIDQQLGHVNHLALVIGISVFFLLTSTILVVARVSGRWALQQWLQIGDWMTLAALVCLITWNYINKGPNDPLNPLLTTYSRKILNVCGSVCFIAAPGLIHYYQPLWDVSWQNVTLIYQWIIVSGSFSLLGHGFVQLSILDMYRSILPAGNPTPTRVLYFVGGAIITGTIAIVPSLWIGCIPFFRNPIDMLNFSKCRNNTQNASTALAAFYVATDFIVLTLPLPMLFTKLRLPRKSKIAAFVMFTIGVLASVFSIVRMVISIKLNDISVDMVTYPILISLCCLFEVHLAIACACLPTIRTLYRSWRGRKAGKRIVDVVHSENLKAGRILESTFDDEKQDSESKGVHQEEARGDEIPRETEA